jgi:hypothetical protein
VRSACGRRGHFGGGPVARWRMEGRGIGRFGRLVHAGEVMMRGGNKGGEVLGVIGVGLEGGEGGGRASSPCLCRICGCRVF